MKKIIVSLAIAVVVVLGCASCTQQYTARNFGGNMTITLQPGEKLMMATWKEDNLFYLTEPMEEDYVPKTKILRESSSLGILETTIKFVEQR